MELSMKNGWIPVTSLLFVLSGCWGSSSKNGDDSAPPSTTGAPTAETDGTDVQDPCDQDSVVGIKAGMCVPDFTFPDQHGGEFTLSDHRGKVALVDISAIW